MKRDRQNKKRNARGNACRTQVKTTTKKTLAAVDAKSKEQAQKALKLAEKTISQVASKGVIHKRTASRKISQLAKKVERLVSVG